jgi:ribonucleoside-diphosphate reductase alpha chain
MNKGQLLPNENVYQAFDRIANATACRLLKPELKPYFYEAMEKGWLCPATPVLSNMGTDRGLPISCLTGDSFINTKTGFKFMKDLKIGDFVLTHKGRFKKITAKKERVSSGDIFSLKVGLRNTKIKITGNHPVLTNLGWVRVDELNPLIHLVAVNGRIELEEKPYKVIIEEKPKNLNSGQFVETPTNSNFEIDEDLAWAIGLWLAEGNITKNKGKANGLRITMSVKEKDIVEKWKNIICSRFNKNGNIKEKQIKRLGKINRWLHSDVYGVSMSEWFLKNFKEHAKNKEMPEWVFDLKENISKNIIDGFIDGDGTIRKNGDVRILVSNPKLVCGLYNLCLKSGYDVSLNLNLNVKAAKTSKEKWYYEITIHNKLKLSRSKMPINAGVRFNDGLIYAPIRELVPIKKDETVYDITVEDDHSFSVAGVVVHNCFGIDIDDTLYDIYDKVTEMAVLTAQGGGVGVSMNRIRGRGEPIRKRGESEGVIPWAHVYDSAIIATSQGNIRRGAASINLNVGHKDIHEFLRMRRPEGDINRQNLNLHHCVQITDDFMNSLKTNKENQELMIEILKTRFETGEPYLHFIDTTNKNNPPAYTKNNLEVSMTNICCLTSDTLVSTYGGPKKIKDLVGKKVRVYDGKDWVNCDNFEMKGVSKILRVHLSGGLSVDCTPNHRWFFSRDYNEIKREKVTEILTSDLKEGMYLEYHTQETHGFKKEPGAYIKGFLLGDGTSHKGKPMLWLYDTKYICEDKLVSSLSEVRPDIGLRSDCIINPSFGEEKSFEYNYLYGPNKRKSMRGLTARKSLLKFAKEYKYSFFEEWLDWNRETKIEFLSGLFDADGTCLDTGIQLVSVSKVFIEGLQEMMATLGYTSTIGRSNDNYRIILSMIDSYNFMKESKCQRLKGVVKKPKQGKNTTWRKVASIEELEEPEEVYCPKIETTGKFALANGLMTGNSEIVLHTDPQHSFVCCLSSLNLAMYDDWEKYTFGNGMNLPELTAWFLEGVMNEFIQRAGAIKGFENTVRSAIKGRAIGIGVLGYHSFLQKKNLPFIGLMSTSYTNNIFKKIKEGAEKASREMATEFGEPEWCKDTGMRHSHLIALAPTVSNSARANASASIEPYRANAWNYKGAQGVYLMKNPQLEELLKTLNQNTKDVWNSIVVNGGSVQHLDFLTDDQKEVFLTFPEIDQVELVRLAAHRQKYIDQTQSINLCFPSDADAQYIWDAHYEAWRKGLKTLYYCRSESVIKGDTGSRKFTRKKVDNNKDDDCSFCEG